MTRDQLTRHAEATEYRQRRLREVELEQPEEFSVPQTDEEVKKRFADNLSEYKASCAIGLYEVRRAMGKSVLEAYESVLLDIIGKNRKEVEA